MASQPLRFLLGALFAGAAQAQAEVPAAAPAAVTPPLSAPAANVPAPVIMPAELPQAAPAAAAPARPPTTKLSVAVNAAEERLFPRYDSLKPAVSFWTRVFGQYSEHQSAIHSTRYPSKVFEVLDFRDEALRMNPAELARYKSQAENQAKARVDKLLAQVHQLRHSPEQMNEQQRRVYRLFADVSGDNKFRDAIGSFRAQRGLRERTALALETSGKYLPEMETIFGRYELPLRLTRLPLVESSFNVEAYSKVGAAGLWQFIPSSAKIYMRLNEVVDDRRDPWTSTDAAARHLRDDYAALKSWPLALTAYNHGRAGIARGLQKVGGSTLPDLIARYDSKSFGFASKNFYAEFLAATDVERNWREHFGELQRKAPLRYETVETKHYVPYETLRRLCDADDELFRKLNPAYRPEVIEGKLYVPPGHVIRVPAGKASAFNVGYAKLGASERFDAQRSFYLLHKVKKGESLGKLAQSYGVSQAAIRSANGLKGTALRSGQVLKIPPRAERRPGPVTVAVGESKPGLTRAETAAAVAERADDARPAKASRAPRTHKVRSGQTLGSIAKHYKVSVSSLRSANGLGSSSLIRVGQKLQIPTG